MGGSYKNVKYKGHTFVFKYDQDAPELLHIYARHRMEPRDAISIFFDSDAVTFYDLQFDRYETSNGEELIYWFWKNEAEKVVMIITCLVI